MSKLPYQWQLPCETSKEHLADPLPQRGAILATFISNKKSLIKGGCHLRSVNLPAVPIEEDTQIRKGELVSVKFLVAPQCTMYVKEEEGPGNSS